ncbi:YraN family protein [Clostridium tarantellae]|uniref:UPF0102 protein GBZ86_01265 n=1 Tax=Clostridium tarantellae TaxID=39493 RepID=A0A6I1MFU5_9CLOT|nr:YraN family protein [Clostridium tarantellae]MPQ42396.1 YraN family protein [Clostridium tarantellae]
MKSFNKVIGNYGENLCISFLTNKGYIIKEKNFKCKQGEIDIICFKKDLLCFIEVKSRFTESFGSPSEAVTCYKKNRILNSANFYIYINNLYDYFIRFDIIEITFNTQNKNTKINYIKDAFRL